MFRKSLTVDDATDSSVRAWFTDIAGARVHIVLNTADGSIRILDEDYTVLSTLAAGAYLTTVTPSDIRVGTVGNEFMLCNVGKTPSLVYGEAAPDPGKRGFLYVVAGAFSKTYEVSVTWSGGAKTGVSYTTPSGASAGDAALATPEYIAATLATQLSTGASPVTVYRSGPYVFIQYSSDISVNSSTGDAYMVTSKAQYVPVAGTLPSRLPAEGDGFICRVGVSQYFKYQHSTTEWRECGVWGSPTSITNVPISIIWNGSAWALNTAAFAGRAAGDDTSNPLLEWMTYGITGMGAYQGRLVILSGPMVALSASAQPRKFFRTTVTSILSSDPIEVGAGMQSAAAYEYAVQFQKDLVLFSRMYQAVLPSGGQAVTPTTATVLPTSSHEVDTTCPPVSVGRTLMYCTPKSEDFFGALEMIPSEYSDAQYTSHDATPHLPKYMGGRCRFAVSSGVANLVLFAPSGDMNSLIVHEYHWSGNEKQQQAWHQWLFEYPVAAAYFAGDLIVVMFVKNETMVFCTIDPRAGLLNVDGERRPFLDGYTTAEIVDHVVTIPAWLLAFDPAVGEKLSLVLLTGALAGEPVGATLNEAGTEFTTVLSHPSGTVGIGARYYSGFIPSAPVVRDYDSKVIHSGKATLLRFLVGTEGSSEFNVVVSDSAAEGEEVDVPTLTWTSSELELGRGLFSETAASVVPCRTRMRSTNMEVFTEDTGELNITFLEYVAKFHPKIKRR